MTAHQGSGKTIQSVQRAIDILNCFTQLDTSLSLGEISERLGLNKATVHGILNTLHNNDYVTQNSSGRYLLGRAIFAKAELLGNTHLNILVDSASKEMQQLSNHFQSNGTLFVVEDHVPRVVHTTRPTNTTFIMHAITADFPLHAAASGKLMLAFSGKDFLQSYLDRGPLTQYTPLTICDPDLLVENLKEVRAFGYSYEKEEQFEGVSAIGAPIFTQEQELYGTLSLTGMASFVSRHQQEMALALKKMAARIQNSIRAY